MAFLEVYFYQSPLPTALSDIVPLEHQHMVEAMTARATAQGGRRVVWAREEEFRQLLDQTLHATPADLEEFAEDLTRETYGKRIYLQVKRNS